MQHQRALVGQWRAIGDADGVGAACGETRAAARQPIGIAGIDGQRDILAGEQRGGHVFHALGIGDAPAFRRRIERDIEAQIPGRRDRWRAAGHCRDGAGQCVGAAMSAQERYDRRAIFRDGDDRWFLALIREQRRQRTDENAAGAQSDDRRAGGEQVAEMIGGLRITNIARDIARLRCVDRGAAKQPLDMPGERQRRRAEDNDRRAARQIGGAHFHASPRRCSRIIEK